MEEGGYLEHSLSIRSHSRMERSAAHVVLNVSISAGFQEAFGSIRARVPSGQVEGGLTGAVSLVMEVGSLINEVGDNFC